MSPGYATAVLTVRRLTIGCSNLSCAGPGRSAWVRWTLKEMTLPVLLTEAAEELQIQSEEWALGSEFVASGKATNVVLQDQGAGRP